MMTQKDAAQVLNLNGTMTIDIIKLAYRKMCAQYHPDRNPAGLEMMKIINAAYDVLRDFEGQLTCENEASDYCEEMATALASIMDLGLELELCGSWAWIHGNTYPHRELLKSNGFKWASKKKCWYFRPEGKKSYNRKSWDMSQIRDTHGSSKIKSKSYAQLQA